MKQFLQELVECRMQLLRAQHNWADMPLNYMCLDLALGKHPGIYIGYADESGDVKETLLSHFNSASLAEEVENLLAEMYPNAHQYRI